jgi:hypothetical protein
MRADCHPMPLRQTDRCLHDRRSACMESTGDIGRCDVRHDLFIVADVLAHVTVDIHIHGSL